MPHTIKVLMADDSTAVRRLVTETLSADAEIQVVGAAANGKEALTLIGKTKPDVILLDVEMPVMDGIDALRQIRLKDRKTAVLMFSSLTVSGGEATLEALSLGANDYVAKPVAAKGVGQAIDYINAELVPKIKLWANRSKPPAQPAVRLGADSGPTLAQPTHKPDDPIDVVAVASSTGGPNALAALIEKLPGDLGVPVVIVQHMPTLFTKLLAERLDRLSPLEVSEAKDGVAVRAGRVLIAPGDYHMEVIKSGVEPKVVLSQGPPENSCRPAADVLFRSVGRVYGSRSLAVVLTGMGKDGLEGCRALHGRGSYVMAQDQASCVVWGMPRAVTEAGIADSIVPLNEIPLEIAKLVRQTNAKGVPVLQ